MSTCHALVDLINGISQSLDAKTHAVCVFIELKKTFDAVYHKLLCKQKGIRGVAFKWLTNYLANVKQYMSADTCKSYVRKVSCGVAQYSILRPKLFIMCVNDMCNISKLAKYIFFADDTKHFVLIAISER